VAAALLGLPKPIVKSLGAMSIGRRGADELGN